MPFSGKTILNAKNGRTIFTAGQFAADPFDD